MVSFNPAYGITILDRTLGDHWTSSRETANERQLDLAAFASFSFAHNELLLDSTNLILPA
jgi:hypothetical protein